MNRLSKKDITEMLISMQFSSPYIQRAFKVYEKNYGPPYHVEVLTEIIVRLQKKDKEKYRSKQQDECRRILSEIIPNPHKLGDVLEVYDCVSKKWMISIVSGKHDHWILVRYDPNSEDTKKLHVIKDKARIRRPRQNKPIPAFRPHMTIKEAMALKADDKIDFRNGAGQFVCATIVEKQGTNLKIHVVGTQNFQDVWCDYNKELYRFAVRESISRRAAHRFTDLDVGGFADVNPIHRHPGWKQAEIKHVSKLSGQIKVVYEYESTNYNHWAHLDDEQEIAEFLSKSLDAKNNDEEEVKYQPNDDDFSTLKPHMTLEEANNLKINDKIDHRDHVGRSLGATVVEKNGTIVKIHYDGWSRKWDTWSDYTNELHRFASPGSISKRPPHRFTNLKKGDFIDINPLLRHPGWRAGEIRRIDQKSGQVQVVYEEGSKNYLYWAHLDDEGTFAQFLTKSEQIIPNISDNDEKNDEFELCEFGDFDSESEENNDEWYYIDLNGKEQGPVDECQMCAWFVEAHIPASLPIRCGSNMPFVPLKDWIRDGLPAFLTEIPSVWPQNGEKVIVGRKKSVINEDKEMKHEEVDLSDMIEKKLKPQQINAMSLDELKVFKKIFAEKLKLIEDAEKELTENTFLCIACMENKKNISFSDGCDHVAYCDECEKQMERKCCPICNVSYTKIKKLAL